MGLIQKVESDVRGFAGDGPATVRASDMGSAGKNDPVSHPAHYTQGNIEVLDFIEDQAFGYHEGCIVKYVCRARYKGNEIQDLRKALTYLERLIRLKERANHRVR